MPVAQSKMHIVHLSYLTRFPKNFSIFTFSACRKLLGPPDYIHPSLELIRVILNCGLLFVGPAAFTVGRVKHTFSFMYIYSFPPNLHPIDLIASKFIFLSFLSSARALNQPQMKLFAFYIVSSFLN